MSKFLDKTGLSYFWDKAKNHFKSNYVGIGDDIQLVYNDTGKETTTIMSKKDGLVFNTEMPSGTSFGSRMDTYGFGVSDCDSDDNLVKSVSCDTENGIWLTNKEEADQFTALGYGGLEVRDYESDNTSAIAAGYIKSPKIIKEGGTASQVLLANGDIATINAAGGIPKLNAQGKLDASLVDIDSTLFEVVAALPTANIKKNRIYLVPSTKTEEGNIYAEYVYVGDVAAAYDNAKWEKLGEYKADIDLTPYASKANIIDGFNFIGFNNRVSMDINIDDEHTTELDIPLATTARCGAMSATDKKVLDTLAARYPLSISKFTATPSLVEVGVTSNVTFAWDFANTDFHPITAQGIAVDGAAAVNVAVGTKSYTKVSLEGADNATTKTASLTVNGSLKKDVAITYHYPSYIGVVANGATITAAAVTALTKSVEWGKGKTAALTQANQKIVYAYPASYGDLTSIKDGNGFQGFAGYTKQTLTINGQAYNVYVQNLPATSTSTYTFA